MMNIRSMMAFGLALIAHVVSAQQSNEDPAMRIRRVMDEAMAQARSQSASKANNLPPATNILSPSELSKTQGADPAAIAARYRSVESTRPKAERDLLIFVSTSMPLKALQMLGDQAKRAGGILVLRGLKGRLGQPGALQATMEALEPVAKTGATIQIDPEAFGRYNVTAVPAFVISTQRPDCGETQCVNQAYSLVGDVSLEYALETWADRGGDVGKVANMFLQRLNSN